MFETKTQKGQIGIMPIVALGATLVIGIGTLAWNAFTKADIAIEKATEANNGVLILQGDLKEIKADLKWLRQAVERQQQNEKAR